MFTSAVLLLLLSSICISCGCNSSNSHKKSTLTKTSSLSNQHGQNADNCALSEEKQSVIQQCITGKNYRHNEGSHFELDNEDFQEYKNETLKECYLKEQFPLAEKNERALQYDKLVTEMGNAIELRVKSKPIPIDITKDVAKNNLNLKSDNDCTNSIEYRLTEEYVMSRKYPTDYSDSLVDYEKNGQDSFRNTESVEKISTLKKAEIQLRSIEYYNQKLINDCNFNYLNLPTKISKECNDCIESVQVEFILNTPFPHLVDHSGLFAKDENQINLPDLKTPQIIQIRLVLPVVKEWSRQSKESVKMRYKDFFQYVSTEMCKMKSSGLGNRLFKIISHKSYINRYADLQYFKPKAFIINQNVGRRRRCAIGEGLFSKERNVKDKKMTELLRSFKRNKKELFVVKE